MSQSLPPTEAASLPLDGPSREAVPAGFVPLRLLLQPGGLCVELTRPDMLVGRHSTADVRLTLPDVSRRHCRFVFTEGRWEVIDLGSLNGIFVNGTRCQETAVVHGDTIRIGSLTFAVDLKGESHTLPLPERAGVLESIASILPGPGHPHRKAS